jgi:hypothetical protein
MGWDVHPYDQENPDAHNTSRMSFELAPSGQSPHVLHQRSFEIALTQPKWVLSTGGADSPPDHWEVVLAASEFAHPTRTGRDGKSLPDEKLLEVAQELINAMREKAGHFGGTVRVGDPLIHPNAAMMRVQFIPNEQFSREAAKEAALGLHDVMQAHISFHEERIRDVTEEVREERARISMPLMGATSAVGVAQTVNSMAAQHGGHRNRVFGAQGGQMPEGPKQDAGSSDMRAELEAIGLNEQQQAQVHALLLRELSARNAKALKPGMN